MQHISDPNYTTILADPAHRKEWQAKINGTVYGEDSLINGSIRQINQLYGDALIGNACSGQLDLSLRKVDPESQPEWRTTPAYGATLGDIPRMAKVELEYRLTNSTLQSAWIPKGTFWINTREEDPLTNTVTLHCVDAMMFGEQDFIPEDSDLPPWNNETMRTVANMCVQKINASTTGVNVVFDNPNDIRNTAPYILNAPPVGYTVRQILSGIAAAHGGNFIITPQNHLRFIPLVPTDTEVDIQTNVSNFTLSKKYEAFGQVIFNFESDDGSTVSALYPDVDKPDGPVIETKMLGMTNSEYATTIAQNVYNTIKTYLYSPYKASDTIIDPVMELGDGLTINGLYTVLAVLDETCDGLYSANIEAPSYEETDYEFVYQTKSDKNLERKLAKSAASFKIGIDSIEALVTGLAPDWAPDTRYQVRDLVKRNGVYYTCTTAHTSGSSFDSSKWSEGTDQATLQNSIKLNIADGLVLSSDAGSDENSCYIQLKYGNITLFAQDIYMNNVRADSLSAQTINAEDVDIAGTLEFYGSLNHPGFESNHNYRSGDIILATARATDWSGLTQDITGLWECTTAHNSSEFSFTMDYSLGRWTYYGPEGTPQLGGYMGFGSGNDGTSQPTKGVIMASSKKSSYGSGDHYVITTNSGVRLQSGSAALYLAGGNIKYSLDGTNFQDLGYAVFS